MIEEEEFERRVSHWFSLMMNAVNDNIHALLSQGKPFTPDALNTPEFAKAMRAAALYQAIYLPEPVLAHFIDPLLPKAVNPHSARLEFLLQKALLQRTAHIQANKLIESMRRPS